MSTHVEWFEVKATRAYGAEVGVHVGEHRTSGLNVVIDGTDTIAVVEGDLAQLREFAVQVARAVDLQDPAVDTSSSASRQHYIDTGRYLPVSDRLEYLRGELRAERISMGELAELQGLADQIEPGDVELLEAAGVPEFPDEEEQA